MKTTTLALSLLAATGGAAAQSSLTVFGVVDAGISHYSTRSRSWGLAAPRQVTQSQTALSPSGYASSRLGFRGTEDLGGGRAGRGGGGGPRGPPNPGAGGAMRR
ncbi:porin, partial [Variovorax sp. CT11-76]